MKLDRLTIHNDDIGSVIGEFYGTPIREYYTEAIEHREEEYLMQIMRASIKSRRNNVESS